MSEESAEAAETFLARVIVTPKPVVNDPQGLTVKHGLRSLGFDDVADVRVGKYIEIRLHGSVRRVEDQVDAMCRRLLANGVIENYRFDVERVETAAEMTT
jgi:phosphoribosylformylglycinamidine synthase